MASHLLREYLFRELCGQINDCSVGVEQAQIITPSTTKLDCVYGVFLMVIKCCVWFSPNVVLSIEAKQLHFGHCSCGLFGRRCANLNHAFTIFLDGCGFHLATRQ